MSFPIDVGVDLDGCLYPFADVVRSWAAGARGERMPEPRGWAFWESEWGWSAEEFSRLRAEGAATGVLYHAGVPDVELLSAMRRLADAGHRLHVLTSRSGEWHVDVSVTREWLWRWGVPHDTLHVTEGEKASAIAALGVRVMVEDSVEEAARIGGLCHVVMWAQPWNAEWRGDRIREGWELERIVETESGRIAPRGAVRLRP